jgi:glycosyltransferase involved in cell wall biosynthesis
VLNVGDFDHFRPALDREIAPEELRHLPRPVLGFSGNFLPTKVDFDLLETLAARRPDATLLLIGPARPDTRERVERLAALPNVRWLGAKAYAELPAYVAAFDVAVIPYVANAYTRSCFPLKLFEYLAAGKPVVATGLPELAGMEPDVVLASGVDGVDAAIDSMLERRSAEDAARRVELASQNTWESRAERLLGLVRAEIAS